MHIFSFSSIFIVVKFKNTLRHIMQILCIPNFFFLVQNVKNENLHAPFTFINIPILTSTFNVHDVAEKSRNPISPRFSDGIPHNPLKLLPK